MQKRERMTFKKKRKKLSIKVSKDQKDRSTRGNKIHPLNLLGFRYNGG